MPKKTKRKNPQDTTLRNVRAAKRRDAEFSQRLNVLETQIEGLEWRYDALQDQIDALSKDRE